VLGKLFHCRFQNPVPLIAAESHEGGAHVHLLISKNDHVVIIRMTDWICQMGAANWGERTRVGEAFTQMSPLCNTVVTFAGLEWIDK
jgi:hypothetical protein